MFPLSPSPCYLSHSLSCLSVCISSLCRARVVGQMHIRGPGGIAQQTSYAIEQPGCPTQHLTRTIIVRPASRRPNDPNLPPSYDQAVTGADRSVKVQEGNETLGKNPLQQPLPQVQLPPRRSSNPPPPAATAPPPPPPPPESTAGMVLPHMPPRQNPAPVSAPPPYPPSPDIDISDRQRLLQ